MPRRAGGRPRSQRQDRACSCHVGVLPDRRVDHSSRSWSTRGLHTCHDTPHVKAAESVQSSLTQQRRPIHTAREISTLAHPRLASGLDSRDVVGTVVRPQARVSRPVAQISSSDHQRGEGHDPDTRGGVGSGCDTTTAVTPNLFTFSGRRDDTQVVFSTTSITGQPQFSYHDDTQDVSASGDESPSSAPRSAHWSPSPWRRCPTCTP